MREMTAEIDGNTIIWTCPTCGRTVVINGDDIAVEYVGDRYVSHRGGTGGLQIGSITVGEIARDESIWREWADEIDLPSFLDNDNAP